MRTKTSVDKKVDITICVLAQRRLHQLGRMYEECAQLLGQRKTSHEFVVIAGVLSSQEEIELTNFHEKFGSSNGCAKVIRVRGGVEKGASLKTASGVLQGSAVLTVETGAEFILSDVEHLLARFSEGFDLVNGVRSWKGEPALNKWQSKAFNWVTRKLTGSGVRDLNSTLKVFRKDVLESIPLHGDFYRFHSL